MSHAELIKITEDVKKSLLSLSGQGIKGFDCSKEKLSLLNNWGLKKTVKSVHDGTNIAPQPSMNKIETLEMVRADIGNCRRCQLCDRRKNLVFGAGNSNARLVFVGEAPGYDEDVQGIPFVGRSGQLLTKMIQAMGLSREDVYICNILKCRPTDNRNPLPEEIISCIPFLKRQLDVIKPEVICALGGFATKALLEKTEGITRLRGHFHDYRGVKLMPVFHPAYLLRNENKKREAWEDLQKVMAVLGLKK